MADPQTIPFRQADPNGHYRSKQLPYDQHDFLSMLGLPAYAGDVVGPAGTTAGQVAIFSDGTGKQIAAATQTGLAKLAVGVLSSVPAPTGAVVGTTDVQTLTNKTLNGCTYNGMSGLTKADVGLGNVDNTSDANKPVSTAQQTALNLKEDRANKGVALGYPTLDASGKVPAAQLPSTGASVYQGTWNAATNTPTIPVAAAGNNGWYYNVNVAGTTNINGISSWAVGDQIISNGTVWQKIPSVQAVNSVNGYTGVVVLTKSDVGLSNVDNTSDANKPVSSATTTQLNLKEDRANKGAVNGYAALDGSGKVPVAQVPADLVTSVAGKQGVVTLVKADVGLGNVDNTSDATKNAAAATLTNKTINGANNALTVRLDADVVNNLPVTNLNSGTGANSGSFWRGDGQWAPPAGGGDLVGPSLSVDGELPLYSGTTGKVVKRCNLSGFVKAAVTGPATAQTQLGAADIANGAITNVHPNVSMISGQTEKAALVDPEDQFLEVDKVTGLLRMVRAKWFAGFPRNWLSGLVLANNATDATNDVNIAAGECRDDTNVADIVIPTAMVKQLDVAWAAGTNAGGRDQGAIADGGWHVLAIRNPTTGVCDVLFTSSPTNPAMPSGFTQKRRIGWVLRASGALVAFRQVGDYVQWVAPRQDINGLTQTPGQFGAAVLPSIPFGFKFRCHLVIRVQNNTVGLSQVEIRDNDQSNVTIGTHFTSAAAVPTAYVTELWCDASRQLLFYAQSVPASSVTSYYVATLGYWDTRGKED